MTKGPSRSWLALIAIAAAALPSLARGQSSSGSVEFGVGGGRFFGGNFAKGSVDAFDRKVGADDDILKGAWVGAQLDSRWGLELAVRRTNTHIVERAGGVAPRQPALAVFIPSSVELLGLRSYPHGNFVPYAGFGVGFTNVEIDTADPAVRDVNRLCLSIAAGARFYAARWIGVRFDLRGRATYLGHRGRGQDGGATDQGRWFRNGEILGGVFVCFGAGPATPSP